MRPAARLPRLLTIVLGFSLIGCTSRPTIPEGTVAPSDVVLTKLGQLYKQTEERLGRPPRNADELKPYAAEFGDLDSLLTSPNDKQRFVVVWGTKLLSAPDQEMIVIYEKTGTKGFRHALTPSGTRVLNDEAFAQASFPPGHVPSQP
jgi:hypothetical protein